MDRERGKKKCIQRKGNRGPVSHDFLPFPFVAYLQFRQSHPQGRLVSCPKKNRKAAIRHHSIHPSPHTIEEEKKIQFRKQKKMALGLMRQIQGGGEARIGDAHEAPTLLIQSPRLFEENIGLIESHSIILLCKRAQVALQGTHARSENGTPTNLAQRREGQGGSTSNKQTLFCPHGISRQ